MLRDSTSAYFEPLLRDVPHISFINYDWWNGILRHTQCIGEFAERGGGTMTAGPLKENMSPGVFCFRVVSLYIL